MLKKDIKTNRAPSAIGSYSQAIRFDRFIFTSRQLPTDPETGEIVGEEIERQARQAISNLEIVLKAGESRLSNVIKTTVFFERSDRIFCFQ